MLQTVRLKNFQSHKDTTVDLVDGVNTFIGTSDHGKSSIMRAINLVAENRPDGTGFVSHWAFDSKGKIVEDTEVELTFDDVTIKRTKGVDNGYTLNGEEYRAFGKQTPEEVKDAVNFYDVNVQRQEQNFFLFSETSGEVIRRINGYVNLDIIDTALAKAEKDARDNKKDIKTNKSQTADIDEKLKPYEVLEKLESLHEQAEALQDKKQRTAAERDKVADYIAKYQRVSGNLEQYKSVDRIARRISKVETQATELSKIRSHRISIQKTVSRYVAVKEKMDSLVTSANISEAVIMADRLDEIGEQIERFTKKMSQYNHAKDTLSKVKERIEELHTKYHEQMGDTCPLCGSKVKE